MIDFLELSTLAKEKRLNRNIDPYYTFVLVDLVGGGCGVFSLSDSGVNNEVL